MKPLLLLLVLMMTVGLSACTSDTTAPTAPTTQTPTTETTDRVFTVSELANYNGQNGQPAYVAVDGVVYDVTKNPSWAGGNHRGVQAGQDVSEMIPANHRVDMRYQANPVVGTLAK